MKYKKGLILTIIVTMLLSGCGSRSYDSGGSASAPAAMKTESAEAYEMDAMNYAYDSAPSMAEYEEAAVEAMPELPAEAGGGVLEQQSAAGRKLIRNVSLELETTEFDSLVDGLKSRIASLGGYIEDTSISGNIQRGATRYGNITARIPTGRLDEFVEHVEESSNITYKNESVQDITLRYVDTDSRKKSLEVERDRLLELMEKAESVADIIEIEARLSEVRYRLESTESQLRTMDNQVDYSTVYISIQEVEIYTPPEKRSIWQEISDGIGRNLRDMLRFTRDLFVELVSGLPIIAVLAVFIYILYRIVRSVRKKLRSRREARINKEKEKQDTKEE